MGPTRGGRVELFCFLLEDFREGRPLHFIEKQEYVKLRFSKGKKFCPGLSQKAELDRN